MSVYSIKMSPDLLENPLDVTTLNPIDSNFFTFDVLEHSLYIMSSVKPYTDKFTFVVHDNLLKFAAKPFATF